MPTATKAYLKFKKELAAARTIVSRVPYAQNNSALHELKVRSLLLLSHSAIEEYLEDLSRQMLTEAVDQLVNNRNVTISLLALLGYHKSNFAKKYRYPLNTPSNYDAFVELAKEAFGKHKNSIDSNHGIREKNIRGMLHPIGIDIDDFYNVLVATLDSFGQKRGAVAHRIGARTSETRSSLTSELSTIVFLLKKLDGTASQCPKKVVITL